MKAPMTEQNVLKTVMRACTKKENKNADGSIKWDFVEADVYMEIDVTDDEFASDVLNTFADRFEAKFA